MADNKATYEISLVDKYTKTQQRITKETDTFNSKLLGLGKTMAAVWAAKEVVQGMTNLAAQSLKLAGGMEQTEVAFNTFLGSAEKGRQVLENLNEFANQTPYTNREIIKTGRSLLAANIPAEELTGTLRRIGDIAAGANVPITDLGSIYAKVMNKGKLQAEELNQLAERGIPIISQLAKQFGVTEAEVFKMGSEGKITSKVMNKAFTDMTNKGGRFFNLMEKQSATAEGLLSTLAGKTELLGVTFGKKLLPAQKAVTRQTISLVDKLNEMIAVPISEDLHNQNREYNALVLSLRDSNKSEDDRAKILARLQEINPATNEIIKQEGDQLSINEQALKAYNEQQLNNIILKKREEKIAKIAAEQNELAVEKREAEYDLSLRLNELAGKINKSDKVSADAKERINNILKEEGSLTDKANKLRLESNTILNSLARRERFITAQGVARLTTAKQITIAEGKLSKIDEQRNDLLKERDKLAGFLGISPSTPPPVITGRIEGVDDVEAGITKITSAAPKVFNLNINNLVENFEVSTTNLTEAPGEIKEVITMTIAEALADVQTIVR